MAIPPPPPVTQRQIAVNNVNDPLYIASSDHPGMVLTNTPFNGTNFHGWSRIVKMALGAKLKLGFIDGSCNRPSVDNVDEQRHDVKRACTHCNQEGHTVDQCFEKISYPDWYKGKMAKKSSKPAAHSSGFDEHFLMDIDWVNDTGASDHMTPNISLFISTKALKKPIIVHLPDGTSKTVTIVEALKKPIIVHLPDGTSKIVTIIGKVQLTPNLILTDVFYHPEFQLNLLSVGKLIQTNNLTAHFYPNDFSIRIDGYRKDGDGDGKSQFLRCVKASANSDVKYSFTSAQDGEPLQDDVRLCFWANASQGKLKITVKDMFNLNTPLPPDFNTSTPIIHNSSVLNTPDLTTHDPPDLNVSTQIPSATIPNDNGPTQSRRSTRQPAKPSWLKDSVTPHRPNAVSTV
ncbi:sulfotransferase 16 [Tanacetum coccineum]|uniref:Sulfotransferase 16 n=1 Tax=Tanacetum coccineum TaxID=301880 RepID=A0ABQ5ECU7_9ASTR